MAPTQKRTPEDVVEQLRAILAELDEITPLSFAERRDLRNKLKTSEETVQASVSIISASDKVANAIGWSSDDVLQIFSDRQRWAFVEGELRTLLNGVTSANLRRRHQLETIAGDTYAIAARDPANADLIPLVEEMQRLRKLERRRKRSNRKEPEAQPEREA